MLGFVEHKFKIKTKENLSLYSAQIFAAIPSKQKDMITMHRTCVKRKEKKLLRNLFTKAVFHKSSVSVVDWVRVGKLDDSLVLLRVRSRWDSMAG